MVANLVLGVWFVVCELFCVIFACKLDFVLGRFVVGCCLFLLVLILGLVVFSVVGCLGWCFEFGVTVTLRFVLVVCGCVWFWFCICILAWCLDCFGFTQFV